MERLTKAMVPALIAVTFGCAGAADAAEPEKKSAVQGEAIPAKQLTADEMTRVAPEVVRQRVTSGKALLVCAYDSAVAFKAVKLEGAISHGQFKKKLPTMSKNQEIYFYCA